MTFWDQIRRVISTSNLPAYVVSFDGIVEYWSESAQVLFGFTSEEIVGNSVLAIIPESHQTSFREFREMLKLQSRIEVSTVRRAKSGKLLPVELSATVVEDRDQRSILVFAKPIKPIRQHIRERNLQASVVQLSADAIMSVSADGIIQSWNPASERLLGYAPGEIIGKPTSTLFPTDRKWARSMGATELAKGNRLMHETIRRHKTGADVHVSLVASPMFTDVGVFHGYTVIFRALNHKEKSDVAVKDAEQFNHKVLKSSKDWICVIDLFGRIMFSNDAGLREVSGDTAASIIDVSWISLWSKDDLLNLHEQIQLALGGNSVEFTATRGISPSSKKYWQVSISPIVGENNQVLRLVAVARDVSAEHHHRVFTETVTKELCHRVKNVLAVISGMARSTRSVDGTVENYQDALISRIFSLSKSHDLLVKTDWSGLELRELATTQLNTVTSMSNISIEGPRLELKTQAGQMLGIAFHELATNAIKYGALKTPGGSIRLTWTIQSDVSGTTALQLIWRENASHTVNCDAESGFGREILEFAVADMLFGSAQFLLKPSGVIWELNVPDVSLISRH